jgi:predicted phage-related endonuclease
MMMDRTKGIGGSDAKRVWDGDWLNLWQEKTGKVEAADLSDVLPVQIGIATESVNLDFLERKLDKKITRSINIPQDKHMTSNVDGIIISDIAEDIIIEAKHTFDNNTLENVAKYYYPQLQHYLMHSKTNEIYLSVIFGNNKHDYTSIESDPEFQKELYKREATFWKFVETNTEPVGFEDLIDSTPDNIPLDGMVKMDMSANKKWITHAESLVKYKPTVDAYEIEKKAIKQLVPNDCRLAVGNGIQVSRNKKGYLTLKQTTTEE